MPPAPDSPSLDLATRHAFLAAPDALLVCALPSAEILHANPAAVRLFAIQPDQFSAVRLLEQLTPAPDWLDEAVPRIAWLARPR